jgi:hypothetical protein
VKGGSEEEEALVASQAQASAESLARRLVFDNDSAESLAQRLVLDKGSLYSLAR